MDPALHKLTWAQDCPLRDTLHPPLIVEMKKIEILIIFTILSRRLYAVIKKGYIKTTVLYLRSC